LSDKQKDDYGKLLKEFSDIFAWQYDDLKTFDTDVIQHKIPLNKDTKPFRQKLRSFNPLLLPTMEKEIRKLLDARIIIPSGTRSGLLTLCQSGRKTEKSDSVLTSGT
jgi:hypothetical protein